MNGPPIPTVAELKRLFTERGIRPNRGRGQSFLVRAEAMRFIAHAADLNCNDVVLEPGAGTGGLTGLLAAQAGAVVAVELDRKLHAVAAERLESLTHVTLIHSDIMERGGTMAPVVTHALQDALSRAPKARFKVVANLPYRISTALVTALLFGDPVPKDIVVTVQREVADRICARSGSKEYGYLTVIVQAVAQAKILKKLSPKAFWPQPDVESAVLRIRPDRKLRAAAGDLDRLRRVAGGLFQHRRKQAARALVMAKLTPDREGAKRLLSAIGVPENVRPEQLDVGQFVEIAKSSDRITGWTGPS